MSVSLLPRRPPTRRVRIRMVDLRLKPLASDARVPLETLAPGPIASLGRGVEQVFKDPFRNRTSAQLSLSRPHSIANRTSSARFLRSSLALMLDRWVSTVLWEMNNFCAISAFVCP